MAQLIFLNELSHSAELQNESARECLENLLSVLLNIRALLPKATLITSKPLASIEFGKAYSVVKWLNHSSESRDRARTLLGFANKAPFKASIELFGDPDPGFTEFRLEGETAEGVGLAYLFGGLPVSFCSQQRWRVPFLQLEAEQLTEIGQLAFQVTTPHASLNEHVEQHREVLRKIQTRDVANAADLYRRCEELFPNLEFGPRIERDLAALAVPAFLQVFEYLSNLEFSIAQWDPKTSVAPSYPPHTTSESKSRQKKGLCDFSVNGGGTETHPMHGRYTPGAGRIFFKIAHGPKRAVIGYIGKKP